LSYAALGLVTDFDSWRDHEEAVSILIRSQTAHYKLHHHTHYTCKQLKFSLLSQWPSCCPPAFFPIKRGTLKCDTIYAQ